MTVVLPRLQAPHANGWKRIYLLSFLLYMGLNAAVLTSMQLPARDIATFAMANTVPPALFGIFVVRRYRSDRPLPGGATGLARHLLNASAFAAAVVSGTCLIIWLGVESRRFILRIESLLWTLIIALLIFAVLASAAHAQRVRAALGLERERSAAAEASRARAELVALRARIHPHFLFNTLHSLLALVRQDPSRAEEAIEQFGDLLRYTFGAADGTEERTLNQEWQLVRNYLALEKLRLGDRLRVSDDIEPSTLGVPLPVLTLQPLVENAIRHAVAPRAGGGWIEIRSRRTTEGICIDISDDGPGAPQSVLSSNPGRGLNLVQERLERFYDGKATLRLSPSAHGGLRVSLSVPSEDE
jgi:sensor histidine kinase YesM